MLAHPPVAAAARVSPVIAISPLPSPIVSLPLPVIPPIGILPSPGVPSPGVPTSVASPVAASSPVSVVPAAPRPTAVAFAPGAGAGTVDNQSPAQPAPPPGDSVVTVESRPAQGSAFTLSLPLVAAPEREVAPRQ